MRNRHFCPFPPPGRERSGPASASAAVAGRAGRAVEAALPSPLVSSRRRWAGAATWASLAPTQRAGPSGPPAAPPVTSQCRSDNPVPRPSAERRGGKPGPVPPIPVRVAPPAAPQGGAGSSSCAGGAGSRRRRGHRLGPRPNGRSGSQPRPLGLGGRGFLLRTRGTAAARHLLGRPRPRHRRCFRLPRSVADTGPPCCPRARRGVASRRPLRRAAVWRVPDEGPCRGALPPPLRGTAVPGCPPGRAAGGS